MSPNAVPVVARLVGPEIGTKDDEMRRVGIAFVHSTSKRSASGLRLSPHASRWSFDLLAIRARRDFIVPLARAGCVSEFADFVDEADAATEQPRNALTAVAALRISTDESETR